MIIWSGIQAIKVMKNRMIDLQVANNKLFFRSIGIVAEFARVDEDSARTALMRAIYLTDSIAPEVKMPRAPKSLLTCLRFRTLPFPRTFSKPSR